MPSKNLIRNYDAPAFYHVYNRGAGKQVVFHNSADKRKFMLILERHLIPTDEEELYPIYDVEVVAFCLMNNHFHLLLYQELDRLAISGLMKSVATAYAMYYNNRYKASGRLFQGPFRASHIDNDTYLAHISRYIHLNPRTYKTYYWSSLRYYIGKDSSELIHPERVLDVSPSRYATFLEDYTDRHELLKMVGKQVGFWFQ